MLRAISGAGWPLTPQLVLVPVGVHTRVFGPFILTEVPAPPQMLTCPDCGLTNSHSEVSFSLGFSLKVCSSSCSWPRDPGPAQAPLHGGLRASSPGCLECLSWPGPKKAGSWERPERSCCLSVIRFLTHFSSAGARFSHWSSLASAGGLFRHSRPHPGCF